MKSEYSWFWCECSPNTERTRRQFCDHLRLKHRVMVSRLKAELTMVFHLNEGEFHVSKYEGRCGNVKFEHARRVRV